jgi:hypothetical protein
MDRRPLPTPVAGGVAGQLDGRLLYAGGTTWTAGIKQWLHDSMIYHLVADEWNYGPSLPNALAYGAGVAAGSALEILGGTDGEKTYRDCWSLNALDGEWQPTGEVPVPTLLGRAEIVAGCTWLFGGCSDAADLTTCRDDVWVRETGGAWSRVSALPHGAVAMPAAAALGRHVYLFGGCSMASPGTLVNCAEAYSFDTASSRWTPLRPLPHPNRGLSAVILDDRFILLAGGYTATTAEAAGKAGDLGFTSAVWVYDAAADTYREASPLILAAAGIELVQCGGTIYAMGGEPRMRDRSDRLLVAPIPH